MSSSWGAAVPAPRISASPASSPTKSWTQQRLRHHRPAAQQRTATGQVERDGPPHLYRHPTSPATTQATGCRRHPRISPANPGTGGDPTLWRQSRHRRQPLPRWSLHHDGPSQSRPSNRPADRLVKITAMDSAFVAITAIIGGLAALRIFRHATRNTSATAHTPVSPSPPTSPSPASSLCSPDRNRHIRRRSSAPPRPLFCPAQ